MPAVVGLRTPPGRHACARRMEIAWAGELPVLLCGMCMEQRIDKYVMANGMVVLGEPMAGVESVAFDFMLPAGAAWMPPGYCGAVQRHLGVGLSRGRALGQPQARRRPRRSRRPAIDLDRQLAPLPRRGPGVEQPGAGPGPVCGRHPPAASERRAVRARPAAHRRGTAVAGRRAPPAGHDRAAEAVLSRSARPQHDGRARRPARA